MNVKGSALVSTIELVESKYGKEGIEKVFSKLPEEDQIIFKDPIIQSEWYPFRLYVGLTEMVDRVFGIGDYSLVREIGKYSAEHDLKTIYRIFYKIGSPQYIIKQAGKVFTTYFDFGDFKTPVNKKGNVVAEIYGIPEISPVFLQRIRGFMEKTLELSGAKNPKVYPAKQEKDGQVIAVFNAFWE